MKRIAILRGGPSAEHDVSLISGAAVLKALTQSGYDCTDIIITKDGSWLQNGKKRQPINVLQHIDVVFVALHGAYGEDGQVQRILEQFRIPFTGSNSLPSALAFNKILTKEQVCKHGVCTPVSHSLKRHHLKDPRTITKIETNLGRAFFAKPPASGSSEGARKIEEAEDTYEALLELTKLHNELLLEEYIDGIEATVGVLRDFRGESLYALPVVEIIPPKTASFYDRAVKYNGDTKHIVPGNFTPAVRDELQRIARLVHTELGCDQYSRSDFLVKNGQVYFLEINTLPGLTSESNFPIAAEAVGLSFNDLICHLIETARI